jgi:hypothetical protein
MAQRILLTRQLTSRNTLRWQVAAESVDLPDDQGVTKLSGIATGERETAGHQVNKATEWHLRSMYDSCLTRTDRHLIASSARYTRPGGWPDGLQSNSLLPRRFRSSGALRTPCGAGRLAHEPCGHQSDACPQACWTGIRTVPISDSAIMKITNTDQLRVSVNAGLSTVLGLW